MAATTNDPLWFSRYDEYPYEQEIAKPEGLEASGFKIEVPAEIIDNLYPADARRDRAEDQFYQEFTWFHVPLEVHTRTGWRTNPAALSPPVPASEEERALQREAYYEVPVSHLSLQTTAEQPFVELPTSRRGVAGIYYCVRQREKNPEGYRATDPRNYMPVARITVVINNVQSELYVVDGQRVTLAAPVTLSLLHEGEVYFRWTLYHYPTSTALAQVLDGLNAAVKTIRQQILTGDLNPHQQYLNLPTQKREISLILAGYDMDANGKILVQTPLPDLSDYNDLRSVTARLLKGYLPLLGPSTAEDDLLFFAEHLQQDVVRLFTGDRIVRNITLKARQRVLTISSASPGGHQGLYRCHTLAQVGVGDDFPIRKLLPDLPDGYGMSWIPTATFRLHIVDQTTANNKLAELGGFTYSLAGTTTASVKIIDVNPEDASKNPQIELRDGPGHFTRSGSASIAWHIELIPSGNEIQHLRVLPRAALRTPDQESRFIVELADALNALDSDHTTPRYTFGHRVTYSADVRGVLNTSERYQLPISADVFKRIYTSLVERLVRVMKLDEQTLDRFKEIGGYTVVVSAFLENPGVIGVHSVAEEVNADEGEMDQNYYNAMVLRMLNHQADKAGVSREAIRTANRIGEVYNNILEDSVKDFQLAESRYSSSEKPLLGMFVIQYDLDQNIVERNLVNAERLRAQRRIEAELRDTGARARELIEANIAQYEPLIKALLANRRVAAEYADTIFKNHVSNLPRIERRDPFEFERALRQVLAEARVDPSLLFQRYRIRPLRYGPPSNPRNQDGYDGVWYRDQETVPIAPLACGEGVALFPATSDAGTTFTDEGVEWLVRCWHEHTTLLVRTSSDLSGPGELLKRPDERTPDDVVKFLADTSNNKAFTSLVSVTSSRTSTALQRMAFEDLHVVITTLTDLNGIRQVIDPANEPLSRFITAIRTVPVEDDDFTSIRYRRVLASVLTTKLARLATILNIVQFQTSESIGYSGPSVVDADPQPRVTAEERAERLVRKQLLSFDSQLYVTQAPIPTLASAIRRVLETNEYLVKLSDADKMFLQEFFRVPEPPKRLTPQLDETPVIVRLPNQGDDAPAPEREEEVLVDFGGRAFTERREPTTFDEDTEDLPMRPRRRVPGLDDESESESSSTGPSPPPSPGTNQLVNELINRFSDLEIDKNKRVGAARYLDVLEEARNNPFRGALARTNDENVVFLTGKDFRGTKAALDKIVLQVMRETRKTLEKPIEALRGVLYTNRQVLTELGGLVYSSTEDRVAAEGLFGHLIQMYDRSLMEVQEIIRDGFETTTVLNPGTFPTNRVQNEIFKRTVQQLRGNPRVTEELVQSTARAEARLVYDRISKELASVDTRFVLSDEAYKATMRSFHFYVDEEVGLKALIKALVTLPQFWDQPDKTANLGDVYARGAKAKLGFYGLIKAIAVFDGMSEEVAQLEQLLRTAPSSISQDTSTRLRSVVQRMRDDSTKLGQDLIKLRKDLDEDLLRARQRVFERIYQEVGPRSPTDKNGKQGLTVVLLFRRLREQVYLEYIMPDRGATEFEAVKVSFDRLFKQAEKAQQAVKDWTAAIDKEVREANSKKAAPRPPTAAPATPIPKGPSRDQLNTLTRQLEDFRRTHDDLVVKMGLRGKSSEPVQRSLASLQLRTENAISHPRPDDTFETLANTLGVFVSEYLQVFWTDKSILAILAANITSSKRFDDDFMRARQGMTMDLPGTVYLGTSLRLFEEGTEQTIRMLAEEFLRGCRRALAVPTWTAQPATPAAAPALAEQDRLARAAKLENLSTVSFQALLRLLRDLSGVRTKVVEAAVREFVTRITVETTSIKDLSDRLSRLPDAISSTIDLTMVWQRVVDLWKEVLDLVKNASRVSHEHLLPWLKDVQNVRESVQQNPRLAGVCALENFCFISDKTLVRNVFSLARQLIELDRERTNAVLTGGLASAVQKQDHRPSVAEEDSKPFISLLKEMSGDLDAGRLPLSAIVARLQPVDLIQSESTLSTLVLPILADRALQPRGRMAEKGTAIGDWQNELTVLCINVRKILVDALLVGRTEVSAQKLIPVNTEQFKDDPLNTTGKIVSATLNTLQRLERALSLPTNKHLYLLYFTDAGAEPALPADPADITKDNLGDVFRFYLKSIRAYLQKTGLKRVIDAATGVAPHLSKANATTKTALANSLVQIFGADLVALYVGASQDILDPQLESKIAVPFFESADLSEQFVRRALELLDVLPPTQHHALRTGEVLPTQHHALLAGEDLLRFFSRDGTNVSDEAYARFVDENLLCGSNRILTVGPVFSTWDVCVRLADPARWRRMTAPFAIQRDAPARPGATEPVSVAFQSPLATSLSLAELIEELVENTESTSKSNIRRPYPSFLINGSLLLDMLRKLDELRTTAAIGTDQKLLVRQLGIIQPLPPMLESRPSDQESESSEEVLASGSTVVSLVPATPATPKAFGLPVTAAPTAQPSDAAKLAADVVLLVNRVSEGRAELQRVLDSWTNLYERFSAQLNAAVKTIVDTVLEEPRKSQLQSNISLILKGFNDKSTQVRQALLDRLEATTKYASLLVKIQEGKTTDVLSDPTLRDIKNVEAKELRDIRDAIAASEQRFREIEGNVPAWIAAAARAINAKFSTSKTLQDALNRGRQLDNAVLAGVQNAGAS